MSAYLDEDVWLGGRQVGQGRIAQRTFCLAIAGDGVHAPAGLDQSAGFNWSTKLTIWTASRLAKAGSLRDELSFCLQAQ